MKPACDARLKLSHLNGEVQNWIRQVQHNRGIIKQPGLVGGGYIEIIIHFARSVLLNVQERKSLNLCNAIFENSKSELMKKI